MPITIANTFVGASTLVAANLDANFTNIANYTTAIPGSDIQAATVANTALINTNFEFEMNLYYPFLTDDGMVTTSPTIPAAMVGMPNVSGDTATYTVKDAAYALTDTATGGTLTFKVQHGYFLAGVWTQVGSDIISAFSVAGAKNANNSNDSGTLTVNSSALSMQVSIRTFLGLFITASSTGLTPNGQIGDAVLRTLSVSFRCIRSGGLRS